MTKKILRLLALSIFLPSLIFANYSGGNGRTAINSENNIYGSSSIVFNSFNDSRDLAVYRGHGIQESKFSDTNKCQIKTTNGQLTQIKNSKALIIEGETSINLDHINSAFHPYLQGAKYTEAKTNLPSLPLFSTSCVKSQFGGNSSHLDERDFSAIRKCNSGNCGSEKLISSKSGIAGTLKTWTRGDDLNDKEKVQEVKNFFSKNKRALGSIKDSEMWFYDDIDQRNLNYRDFPKYYHSLENLKEGDIIRLFVYAHNNAEQGKSNNTARNTVLSIDYSDAKSVNSQINSNQTSAIQDKTTLSFADNNAYTLKPKPQATILRGNISSTKNITEMPENKTLTVNLGNLNSSYAGVQRIYVDFVVEKDTSIAEEDIEITKSANPPHNSNVNIGDVIQYTVNLENTGNTILQNINLTDTLDSKIEFVEFVDKDEGIEITETDGFLNIKIAELEPKSLKSFQFSAKVKEEATGVIINKVEGKIGEIVLQSNEVIHNIIAVKLEKSANPPHNSNVNIGDVIQYTVNLENTGNTNLQNINITDTLDSKIEFVEFGDKDEGIEITETDGVLNITIAELEPKSLKSFQFSAKVKEEATGEIINKVEGKIGEIVLQSNEVIHNIIEEDTTGGGGTTTSGGGGSYGKGDSFGVCTLSQDGSPSCTAVRPDDRQDVDYINCLQDMSAEGMSYADCATDWAFNRGYTNFCTTKNGTPATDLLGQSYANIVNEECNPVIFAEPIECEADYVNDPSITIEKFVMTTDDENELKIRDIANGEQVHYRIAVDIKTGTKLQNIPRINKATLKVYDFIVPTESGWVVTDRETYEDPYNKWKWHQNGNYFEKIITDQTDLNAIRNLGLGGDGFRIDYEAIKTELNPDVDNSTIKNVAFAVVDFDLVVDEANENSKLVLQSPIYVDGKQTCDRLYLPDLHSLGSTATANLTIHRPFVQTRGGANESKLDNTLDLDSATKFAGIEKKPITRLGEKVETAADNSGIYFFQDGFTIDGGTSISLGRSETFVIESGDLIINKDLNISGEFFPAFILQNGDVIIGKDVKKIDGIFITENGEIKSDGGISRKQLIVSGGLLGNASDLLENRKYIGEFNNGVLDGSGLQPSIKIVYDLRLIENTPPGLSEFLGSDWQQSV